jgi:carbonyl reductase 1
MSFIAFVTGANQGLGLALVRGLGRAIGSSGTVYLGARDESKGRAAAATLRSEGISVELLLIDVTDAASINTARDIIFRTHGGVDIVISNAAQRISKDLSQADQVARFIDTNNIGQRRVTDAFRDILRPGARFLVVASAFGSLRNLDPRLHAYFDVERATLDDIDATMAVYAKAVIEDRAETDGWPEWINTPSKIGQVAAMKVFARQMAGRRETDGLLVAAVCPGLVDTDASRPWFADMSQARTPDAAAAPIISLALSNPAAKLPYGELIQYGKVINWI